MIRRAVRQRGHGSALLALFALAGLPALQPLAASDTGEPRYPDGAASFQANCAVCHGGNGAGQPSLAPPLTSYPARYIANPEGRRQLAMTVLYGMFGDITVEQKHYNFKMPEFGKLSDDALSALLNYVVFDLAHASDDNPALSAAEIASVRGQPVGADAVRQHRAALLTTLGLAN
jgi:mono/diheme cytochrome c family protein